MSHPSESLGSGRAMDGASGEGAGVGGGGVKVGEGDSPGAPSACDGGAAG